MIAKGMPRGQVLDLAGVVELWHCGTCDVIFDRASAALNGGVIACPTCGRVNLGYVAGPAGDYGEEIEVIDPVETQPDKAAAARGSEKFTSTDELIDLLQPELERFSLEADEARKRMEEAKRAAEKATQDWGQAQNTYARLSEFLGQLRQEPKTPRGSAQRG